MRPAIHAGLKSCATSVWLLASVSTIAASIHDPALRFRTVSTEHFIIYYHQGEDRLAARLAVIAEETWRKLRVPLGVTPPARTHVIVADESELANGFAIPLPYNTIFLTAAWPAGSVFIGKTDDWLRLAFTHEFTHIVHLDRSEGWARVVRGIFGRTPVAFPNLFLPTWQIEGLATYEESALTGEGRLHAGDFQAIVREAVRRRRLEPLDRVNGGLTDWPDGLAPYAYGLGFHAYLADRFGAPTLAQLAERTARRVPFTASRVFKGVYGKSLGELWRDYRAALIQEGGREPEALLDNAPRRLTHHGFGVLGPRFAPSTCDRCPPEVIYAVRTPHGFPALNRVALDGSSPVRIANRYLGSTAGVGRHTIVFDQQELHRDVGLYSDLYALDRPSGHLRQLTFEARFADPDLSPDEQTIVAVRSAPGRRDLVLVRRNGTAGLKTGAPTEITTLLSEPETQFNAPRWSPDGRAIAVERHRPGVQSEIVVVDMADRSVRVVASDALSRVVTPAWRRDGRAIVAAADPGDGPFNLYEFSADGSASARQLTHTTGGAMWPDISPDGLTIVFVGYTTEGFDLFEMPYPASAATGAPVAHDFSPAAASPVAQDFSPAVPADVAQDFSPAHTTEYSPWPTLPPTAWSPIVEGDSTQLRLGAATYGTDVLGYHAYSVSATWLVSGPSDAVTPQVATPDWQLAYAYDRWRPTFWVAASAATSFFAGPATDRGVPATATLRERQLEAGMLFQIRHVRTSNRTSVSFVRAADEFMPPDDTPTLTRAAARAAWTVNSARSYGYSISQEDGVTFGATAELVRRGLGASADATAVTADSRFYLPSFAPHHVLAVRLAGGTSTGDATLRRTFHLGGAAPNLDTADFGRQAMSLLRGFAANTFGGRHVVLMNADYRWPIARPQRGAGTWPLFLHTVHAAMFADTGHAWNRTFRARDLQSSAGAELSFDLVAGYAFPFTATVGAAWGHDGSQAVGDRATVYVRVGRAF